MLRAGTSGPSTGPHCPRCGHRTPGLPLDPRANFFFPSKLHMLRWLTGRGGETLSVTVGTHPLCRGPALVWQKAQEPRPRGVSGAHSDGCAVSSPSTRAVALWFPTSLVTWVPAAELKCPWKSKHRSDGRRQPGPAAVWGVGVERCLPQRRELEQHLLKEGVRDGRRPLALAPFLSGTGCQREHPKWLVIRWPQQWDSRGPQARA